MSAVVAFARVLAVDERLAGVLARFDAVEVRFAAPVDPVADPVFADPPLEDFAVGDVAVDAGDFAVDVEDFAVEPEGAEEERVEAEDDVERRREVVDLCAASADSSEAAAPEVEGDFFVEVPVEVVREELRAVRRSFAARAMSPARSWESRRSRTGRSAGSASSALEAEGWPEKNMSTGRPEAVRSWSPRTVVRVRSSLSGAAAEDAPGIRAPSPLPSPRFCVMSVILPGARQHQSGTYGISSICARVPSRGQVKGRVGRTVSS